jgi:hypothetical protein
MSLGGQILVEELAARNAQQGNVNIQPTED